MPGLREFPSSDEGTDQCPIPVSYTHLGSIIPWGPAVQYATEKSWDDLEIRVYPGANATFIL